MILARSPATAWRIIEGEAVILSLDAKVLRGLNPVGRRVWELIDGQRSEDEIAQMIAKEFAVAPDVAACDVRTVVEPLLAKGLVIAAS